MVYSLNGTELNSIYKLNGDSVSNGYDIDGEIIFPSEPFPSGDLNAKQTIALPSPYGDGKGFTCTGLAKDGDSWLVGDIGKQLPNAGTIHSVIQRLSADFSTILETLPISTTYPSMSDVQGVAVDGDTIWFVSPLSNKVYHITKQCENLGSISVTNPTGVAYDATSDSLWVLTYANKIINYSKTGTIITSYNFSYSEQLDQCCIYNNKLYITAGANYSGRNNVYYFDLSTHEQGVACTVDSYSVEGIWIGENEMIIVNDGYYHSAYDGRNIACFYSL